MSFSNFKTKIEEGDTVILYVNPFQIYAIEVKPQILNKKNNLIENIFQTQYGGLKVISLVGKEFGSRIYLTKGYAYVLQPTPELWTLTLPHRTQILYTPDISLIITELDIVPGSVVCEAGTGSGSLSHAFLRAIGSKGKLYSCDFHQERVEAAQKEFDSHGLGSRVVLEQRDVCTDGWREDIEADSVFLDLPKPWEALPHAVKAIKSSGGRVCSFSPCIEQVKKTCELMKTLGLTEINTCECLQREFQMKNISIPPVNVKKVPLNRMLHMDKFISEHVSKKLKTDDPPGEESANTSSTEPSENTLESVEKESKENGTLGDTSVEVTQATKDPQVNGDQSSFKFKSAVPLIKIPGHTGYLTFASVPPQLSKNPVA